MSLRSKLCLAVSGIIALVGIAALSYVNVVFQSQLLLRSETTLTHQARLIRNTLGDATPASLSDSMVDRLWDGNPTRITVIALDGEVLADTRRAGIGLATMENHGNRPEIQQALREGYGRSIRTSPSLGIDMMYVAIPWLGPGGRPWGTIRASQPLESVRASLGVVRGALIGTTIGGIALTLLITWLSAGFLLRTLLGLIASARRIAAGDPARGLPTERKDELGELARALRGVTEEIAGQMNLLRRERNQLEAILNSLNEGVLVLDSRGKVVLANAAAHEFLGLPDVVAGEGLGTLVRHQQIQEVLKGTVSNGTERRGECEIAGPPSRHVVVRTSDFDFGDDERGKVAVFYDITEQKRLESVRRDFVASASHELRTPVTAIRGYAETLRDGAFEDPAVGRPFVENLHRQSLRLSALVEDLLSLSRLESGEWRFTLDEVNLEGIVQAALRHVEFAAQQKGIELITDLSARKTRAEEAALEQVLINLLDNAIKYSPDGSRIWVTSFQKDRGVAISVQDEGIGIPEEHRARIFERFYRVDPARSRELGGTGLGLAIVKHLVQSMGAEIGVQSAPGKGSTFTIVFPSAGG